MHVLFEYENYNERSYVLLKKSSLYEAAKSEHQEKVSLLTKLLLYSIKAKDRMNKII